MGGGGGGGAIMGKTRQNCQVKRFLQQRVLQFFVMVTKFAKNCLPGFSENKHF